MIRLQDIHGVHAIGLQGVEDLLHAWAPGDVRCGKLVDHSARARPPALLVESGPGLRQRAPHSLCRVIASLEIRSNQWGLAQRICGALLEHGWKISAWGMEIRVGQIV